MLHWNLTVEIGWFLFLKNIKFEMQITSVHESNIKISQALFQIRSKEPCAFAHLYFLPNPSWFRTLWEFLKRISFNHRFYTPTSGVKKEKVHLFTVRWNASSETVCIFKTLTKILWFNFFQVSDLVSWPFAYVSYIYKQ